jgi:hypothetical protein
VVVLVPERVADGRALARAGHPRPPGGLAAAASATCSSRRSASSADHLEIRWDLDVEAQERARELGHRLDRIELPNADPAFVRVLAGSSGGGGCTV